MVNWLSIVTVIVAIATVGIGLLTYVRNTSSKTHRALFVLSIFIGSWMVTNLFSNNIDFSHSTLLLVNRFLFMLGAGTIMGLPFFYASLTLDSFFLKHKRVLTAMTLLVMGLGATSLVVADVQPTEPIVEIIFGPLAVVYFLSYLVAVALSLKIHITAVRQSTGIKRARLHIIGFSIVVPFVLNALTNGLLPFIFGTFEASLIGPLFQVLVVVGLSYGIIKHRLFDVRLAVTRTIAYILVLTVFGLMYGLIVFAISNTIFNNQSSTLEIATDIVVALLLTTTLQPLKRVFDTVTNKLFYRESYELREALDSLGRVFVAESEVDTLIENSLSIFTDVLRPSFARIIVLDGGSAYRQSDYGDIKDFKATELKNIAKYSSLIITDFLPENEQKEWLLKRSIAVVMPLVANSGKAGILVLGPKTSGNIYNSQDESLLKISASNLAVAIANNKKYEEISKFNKTLQAKVDRATVKLRNANEHLKTLDRTKDDFISMTSHQLRPQLTAALGFTSLLDEGSEGQLNKGQKELTELSLKSVNRMIKIVTDLLDISKMKSGNLEIKTKVINFNNIIKDEVLAVSKEASAKGVEISFVPSKKVPQILADETKLREAVSNLVLNAVQYCRQGDNIKVQTAVENGSVLFTVKDSGIGVPEKDQSKLFTKFYRGKNAKTVRPTGTGIGLFMVGKVIDAHNGVMVFESEENVGSVFGFKLPV